MSDSDERRASILSSGLTLAVLAAVCSALVAITWHGTRARIAANEQAFLEARLKPVIEGISYDGQLSESTITIDPPHALPGRGPVTVYRVFSDDRPVAALFVVTARDGYSGPIRLLLGVDRDGRVTRVRVLEHRETPGLGDRIESSKSDWLDQFESASIGRPAVEDWAVAADGGEFDQLTGATITSRAVVKAVRETLLYFESHRDTVFAAAESDSPDP